MAGREQFTIKQEVVGIHVADCKYGENPYMQGALYHTGGQDPLALNKFQDEGGDARSLVNYTDVDRLLQTITHVAAGFSLNFGDVPAIAIGVKHGNPCGVGVSTDGVSDPWNDALMRMVEGDERAIFGGVVMTNFPIGTEEAETLRRHHMQDGGKRLLDTIVAPSFHDGAREELERKGGKCRLLSNPALGRLGQMHWSAMLDQTPRRRYVRGGYLEQTNYTFVLDLSTEEVEFYGPELTEAQKQWLVLASAIGSTSNSNTMTVVRDGMLLGNGVGQQDRVGAAELAIKRASDAGHSTVGAVAYSDSFFPFPDGVQVLVDAGIGAIFASSGSVNDHMTIEVCEKSEVSLVMVPDKLCRGFAWH